ncbi:MAG TPA: VWA domain-containing protein, partial [Polyangiaceae bacterium]|nr:VWA domain-containing protein [Polyangiaceae bacterium]
PAATMGATPGGAQDIDYARDRIKAGEVPHSDTFTPEGLFSQHDLPLPGQRPCQQVLCLTAAAARAELIAQPEVRYLAQLGFSSNIDPKTWHRSDLNLVAVVDKSGSMSGRPLDTVKASLRRIALQMTARDQLSIVLYGDRSHVHLAPTPLAKRAHVLAAIDSIQSAGSTAMEEGLRVGFEVAQQSQPRFKGVTRMMLFTDERPNVGATDARSFMGMARAGSRRGIGLTTIGVGTHFGAELATAISSVRGGNLFFFPDETAMNERFQREFDTMVSELAYDLKLVVKPAAGYELVGLYGVPGDLVKRTTGGGLELTIETVFLSHDAGGIFFAFKPAGAGALPPGPGAIAEASLVYVDSARRAQKDVLAFPLLASDKLPLGLARGLLLVDEITTLKQASILHGQQNQTEKAYRLVRALKKKLDDSRVSGLGKEKTLVSELDATLTRLSGHQGEAARVSERDPLNGLPRR